MTQGEWRVVDGRHLGRDHARAEYARVIAGLYGNRVDTGNGDGYAGQRAEAAGEAGT
jgi:hypothetical protein